MDEDTTEDVDYLRRAGLPAKKILEMIKSSTTCNATVKDVHNLIARLSSAEHNGASVEERLRDVLVTFCESNENNTASVFASSEGINEVHPAFEISTVGV